jgi:uncharacterized protein YyaL (SSP411 family)
MMKLQVVLFIVLLGHAPYSWCDAKDSIEWLDWNDGFEKAKQEGKIALIDCYTAWCGWCKVMDKKSFTDTTVIRLVKESFVPIKFNPELKRTYLVGKDTLTGRQLLMSMSNNKPSGYPTLYFFVPERNQMFHKAGYIPPDQLIHLLRSIVDYQDSAVKKE